MKFVIPMLLATLVSPLALAEGEPKIHASVFRCTEVKEVDGQKTAQMKWLIGAKATTSNAEGELKISHRNFEVDGRKRMNVSAVFKSAGGETVRLTLSQAQALNDSNLAKTGNCDTPEDAGQLQMQLSIGL